MKCISTYRKLTILAFFLMSGCVPFRGDYSEFSSRSQGIGRLTTDSKQYVNGIYKGEIVNGFPHGNGVFYFSNGDRYEGSFSKGRFQGVGRMTYADGRSVVGQFASDLEKEAVLTYEDGSKFSGKIARGRPDGQGVLELPDGSTITGNFRGRDVDGTGLLVDADGVAQYAGSFKDAKPHGQGICRAGTCFKSQGMDTTEQELDRMSDFSANERVRFEHDLSIQEENKRSEAILRDLQSERLAAEKQVIGFFAPGEDDPCHCIIDAVCLTISDPDEVLTEEERRLQKLKDAQSRLECENRFSGWLGKNSDPDFERKLSKLKASIQETSRKIAAEQQKNEAAKRVLEDKKQKALADAENMRQLAEQERKKLLRDYEKRQQELKQQCADPGFKKSHPCRCGVVTPVNERHRGACEA